MRPPRHGRVLLVDDDVGLLQLLQRSLQREGHHVAAAPDLSALRPALRAGLFDVCVVDIDLGPVSGLDLLPELQAANPGCRVIMATAATDPSVVMSAVRAGAADYLVKPYSPDQLLHAVAQQLERVQLERRLSALQEEGRVAPRFDTADRETAAQLTLARRVAETDATVLILGENGTGKSQLARALHAWSPRRDALCTAVSCAALSAERLASELFGHVAGAFAGADEAQPGRVALAEGGTLLLDEVGDLPLALQPRLLRFLQDRSYERVGDPDTRTADVRIVATSNHDLPAMIAEGRFREDLYYRLNVVSLRLPPLRERADDILPLASAMLTALASHHQRPAREFSAAAAQALLRHPWPGNLRELRNAIERAVIVGQTPVIDERDLPFGGAPSALLPSTPRAGDPIPLEALERAHIEAIVASAPSLEAAARILGIDSSTLYRKRRQYLQQRGAA